MLTSNALAAYACCLTLTFSPTAYLEAKVAALIVIAVFALAHRRRIDA